MSSGHKHDLIDDLKRGQEACTNVLKLLDQHDNVPKSEQIKNLAEFMNQVKRVTRALKHEVSINRMF